MTPSPAGLRLAFVLMLTLLGSIPAVGAERGSGSNAATSAAAPPATVPVPVPALDMSPGTLLPLDAVPLAMLAPPPAPAMGTGGAVLLQGGGPPPSQLRYYALDALGSVRVTFDAAGNVIGRADYEPFGAAVAATTTGTRPRQQFTGQERDGEVATDYFGARNYLANLGRMPSVDPLFDGAVVAPQRWNRYAYALNRPTSVTDPDGRLADECGGYDSCVTGTADVAAFDLTSWLVRVAFWSRSRGGSGSTGGSEYGSNGFGGAFEADQTPVDPKTNAILQQAVDEIIKFEPSEKCNDKVISRLPGRIGTSGGFDLRSFKAYLGRGADFFDGRNDNRPLAGPVTLDLSFNRTKGSIADHLRIRSVPGGSTANAAVTSVTAQRLTVYLGSAALSGGSAVTLSAGRAFGFVFHEGAHGFTGKVDSDIMDPLGLGGKPSVEVSKLISTSCR